MRDKQRWPHALMLAGICCAAQPMQCLAAENSDELWWSITPYLWASKTKLDLALRESGQGPETEITFGDLLDVLDAAAQINIEGGRGHWSGFSDFTYIATSETTTRPTASIDANNKQIVVDAAAVYWPQGVNSGLNFFGGLRYSGFDDRYRFTFGGERSVERGARKDYYDMLLGVRYRFELSQRWSLATHGDTSFGDSQGTWQVRGVLSYAVGKRRLNRIGLGYQYKQAEFKDGGLTTKFTYSGPVAGFSFRF